jgi:hypothetical protein
MEAHEQENKDFMKLIVKDYAVPYITQIPACLVFDCVDWILQQEEKDWIDYAYVEYMMQNVMTDKKE